MKLLFKSRVFARRESWVPLPKVNGPRSKKGGRPGARDERREGSFVHGRPPQSPHTQPETHTPVQVAIFLSRNIKFVPVFEPVLPITEKRDRWRTVRSFLLPFRYGFHIFFSRPLTPRFLNSSNDSTTKYFCPQNRFVSFGRA